MFSTRAIAIRIEDSVSRRSAPFLLCKEPQTYHAPVRRRFIKISIFAALRRIISVINNGGKCGEKRKKERRRMRELH